MRRYVWQVCRVMPGGERRPVRHYLTLRAAQHRACSLSQTAGFKGERFEVYRSTPVAFGIGVARYRDGVLEFGDPT